MTRGSTPRAGRLPDFTGVQRVLPREGRQVPPPLWPLPGKPSARERQLWAAAWRRPQAVLWEEEGLADLAALYVRKTAEAEMPGSKAATVESSRRLADDLYLTVPAMKRAGVAIAPPESATTAAATTRSASPRPPSSRERFRVVKSVDVTSDPTEEPA